jgi:1,4-dihydroxy-2-naphthoate polyprenyltransferase
VSKASTKLDTASVTKAFYLARLMRPENLRFSLILLLVVGLHTHTPAPHLITSCLLLLLCYGLVTAYNDLQDQTIDTANRRHLPLVQGHLAAGEVRHTIVGLLISVAFLQLFVLQPIGLIFTATFLILGWAYSSPPLRLENHGLFGTLLLAVCYSTLPLLLGGLPANTTTLWLILACLLFSATTLLFKDFKDETGDRLHDKRTPLVRYGHHRTKALSVIFFAIGQVLLLIYAGSLLPLIPASVALFFLWQTIKPFQPPITPIIWLKISLLLAIVSALVISPLE